jgi:hypothetical protein
LQEIEWIDETWIPGDERDPGLMLPVPAKGGNEILLERRDGKQIRTTTAHGLALHYRGREVSRFLRIRARVYLTDARLAVICTRYDKGGGWVGDPINMAVFNTASKIRAAVRSNSKVLVGQARYPWMARVGSTAKIGLNSEERLVIDASQNATDPLRLVLGLSADVSASELAAEVVRRAAAYRLRSEADLDRGEHDALETAQGVSPISPNHSYGRDHIYFHEMPSCWYISEKSAAFAP